MYGAGASEASRSQKVGRKPGLNKVSVPRRKKGIQMKQVKYDLSF